MKCSDVKKITDKILTQLHNDHRNYWAFYTSIVNYQALNAFQGSPNTNKLYDY